MRLLMNITIIIVIITISARPCAGRSRSRRAGAPSDKINKISNVKKTYDNFNDDITLNKTSNTYYNDTYNIIKTNGSSAPVGRILILSNNI